MPIMKAHTIGWIIWLLAVILLASLLCLLESMHAKGDASMRTGAIVTGKKEQAGNRTCTKKLLPELGTGVERS